MLELSETNACLHNLHSVRELDADGDLLADVGLIFTLVKKLKPCGSNFPPLYYSLSIFRLYKVQGDDGQLPTNPSVTPALRNYHVQNSFAQGD